MGGCSFLNFNFVLYRVNRLRAFYRSKGLKSQLITLDNGSTMHCWVPKGEEAPKPRRWSSRGPAQSQAQSPSPAPHTSSQPPRREKPALLFIHGFGGDGTIGWENQIAAFTKDYSVLVPDLLFFGTSTTKNTQRTEIFQADCLKDMLTKLDVKETHVVGTSYGGFVAFWMAYKYPTLCRKVVICSSGVCMTPKSNDPILAQCNLSSISDILLPTTVDGLKLAFSLIYARPPGLPDFIVQQILDLFYALEDRPNRIELLNGLVIGSEKCPPLPVLQQKVLIVWGREDQIFKLGLAHQLQQHLGAKNAEIVVIEAVGHMPQLERPKEFNYVVRNFLDDSVPEDSL